ncbi:MAG: tyrosine-type recombinase/integrase [Acetobacter sp.]|uniref:tyrosine-type recombinase/integrase n=1 Tax=Acetobacter sp. TaxID=440 RepID=UPI003F92F00B
MKFTKPGIDALTCPPGKRDAMFTDSEVKGFAIRVNATGSKTFLFNYRFAGKPRRLVLGQYGELTLAHARKLAEAARGKVLAGGDPAGEKKAIAVAHQQQAIENAKQAAANALTFAALTERWASNALRDSSESHTTEAPRRLRYNFADMLDRPAHALTVTDIQNRLDDVAENHPTTARRLQSYGRAMYAWAVKRQLLEHNPFAHVVIEGREVSRNRVLTDAELGAAWRAACQMPYAFGPFFKLLILTLQRRSEVAGMRWDEITPDLTTWTIPASRTKNGKEHIVHLSDPARQVLASMHRQTDAKTGAISPLVFTNTGKTPISGFSDAKERLEALMVQERASHSSGGQKNAEKKPSALPVNGWRLHDLRRTGVTTMARLGIGPHVADRVLNHIEGTISGVAAVYQRHEFLTERAAALDAWAAHVLNVASGLAPEGMGANVIPLWR